MFCTVAYVLTALAALVHGAPECDGGKMESTDVNDQILKFINERRSTIIQGNQKNGQGDEKLPAGKYMNHIYWNCDLEKEAMAGLTADCSDPAATSGKSQIFMSDYDDAGVPPLSTPIGTWLGRIDDYALTEYKNGAVKYSGENAMTDFSNMINPKTSDIGCALGNCANEDGETKYQVYCITNQPPVSDGDTIYEQGNGGCEGCPEGTTCDGTSKLCVRAAAAETTAATTTTTMESTTVMSTTTTPAGEAIYPTGPNTQCPDHEGMTDQLRIHYLDTHNFRRRDLANGTIPKNNGNLLPKAANMIKLELDCELEAGAIAHASTCPTAVSDPATRDGIGEHYHRVPMSTTVPTYRDGIKSAVTNWWKVVRLYPGIGMAAMFRATHVGTPIETFTQMGWAKTSKLGCSIVTCKTDYVVICRYYPKGNIVEQNVYIPGTPCTQCMGTCYNDLLLCSA